MRPSPRAGRALKLIADAVAAVQANTDRISVELALARSQRELAGVDDGLDGVERDLKKVDDWVAERSSTARGVWTVGLLLGFVLTARTDWGCFAFVLSLGATVLPYQLVINWIVRLDREPLLAKRAELAERRTVIKAEVRKHKEALGLSPGRDD